MKKQIRPCVRQDKHDDAQDEGDTAERPDGSHRLLPDHEEEKRSQNDHQAANQTPEALDVVPLPLLLGSGVVTGDKVVPLPDQNQNTHHGAHQRHNNKNDHGNSLIDWSKDSVYPAKSKRRRGHPGNWRIPFKRSVSGS